MRIVVAGAGSLGSLIGGLLAREHEVTLVGRGEHVRAITESGLRITDVLERHVTPAATTDYDCVPAPDLAIVTVKAYDTAAAGRDLARIDPGAVCSLQNGMGNEAVLADVLDDVPILAGTVTYGALRGDPGTVACTGRGEIELGPVDGGASDLATRVAEAFTAAGLACTARDDMPDRLWTKLAVNAGINAVTALARLENGAVLEEPVRPVAFEAARETARVARSSGVELADDEVTEALADVARTTRTNTSSMARDVLEGRRTEVDAINGFVVDRAPSARDVPVNDALHRLLVGWERGRGLR